SSLTDTSGKEFTSPSRPLPNVRHLATHIMRRWQGASCRFGASHRYYVAQPQWFAKKSDLFRPRTGQLGGVTLTRLLRERLGPGTTAQARGSWRPSRTNPVPKAFSESRLIVRSWGFTRSTCRPSCPLDEMAECPEDRFGADGEELVMIG